MTLAKNRVRIAILFLFFTSAIAAIAADDKPKIWKSADETEAIVVMEIRGQASEEKLRNQTAGMLDGITNPELLLFPERFSRVTLSGLPGVRLDGVSHGQVVERGYSLIALFAVDRSYLVHCVSPLGSYLTGIDEKVSLDGRPYKKGEPVLDDIARKGNGGLEELQTLMKRVIKSEKQKKANKALEPTRGAGTSAAVQPRVPAPRVAHL